MQKIASRDNIISECQARRESKGERIVYTSGVFDILHPGHVQYLEAARARGDCLVVGLNSDSSVRRNKGELRPINDESARAAVLAGLAAVDYIFVFDELNNNRNIELLKPDVYVKAGDYSPQTLSSAPLVQAYGGEVVIIPSTTGFSTSTIIDRIAARYSPPAEAGSRVAPPTPAPAVFLDRDGTLIEQVEYLFDPSKVAVFPGAFEALAKLKTAGFRLVMTTNQPGIGLGYFTVEDFFAVNRRVLQAATKAGVMFDKVYFCPHHSGEGCRCRKPAVGMIDRARADLAIEVEKSFVVGDTTLDLQLAKNAGCRSVLVRTGIGGNDNSYKVKPDFIAADLAEAVEFIVKASQ